MPNNSEIEGLQKLLLRRNKADRIFASNRLVELGAISDELKYFVQHSASWLTAVAKVGKLHLVPMNLLMRNLDKRDKAGNTILGCAIVGGTLDKVPKQLLTKEFLLPIGLAAYGRNCLHLAAIYGQLDKVPAELLVLENLQIKDCHNYTVFHCAAFNRHLDQIPRALLTKENLFLRGPCNNTVLHIAAATGALAQIPEELLTVDNLLDTYNLLTTCFHDAAEDGHFDTIPKISLTEEALLVRNSEGISALQIAAEHKHLDQLLDLGVKLSVKSIPIVGKDWFERYQAAIKSIATLVSDQNSQNLEMF